jgi:acetone carboxylase gamma subunit
LNDHLFVVGTDDARTIKATCGLELCDAGENWKMECNARVRERKADVAEL